MSQYVTAFLKRGVRKELSLSPDGASDERLINKINKTWQTFKDIAYQEGSPFIDVVDRLENPHGHSAYLSDEGQWFCKMMLIIPAYENYLLGCDRHDTLPILVHWAQSTWFKTFHNIVLVIARESGHFQFDVPDKKAILNANADYALTQYFKADEFMRCEHRERKKLVEGYIEKSKKRFDDRMGLVTGALSTITGELFIREANPMLPMDNRGRNYPDVDETLDSGDEKFLREAEKFSKAAKAIAKQSLRVDSSSEVSEQRPERLRCRLMDFETLGEDYGPIGEDVMDDSPEVNILSKEINLKTEGDNMYNDQRQPDAFYPVIDAATNQQIRYDNGEPVLVPSAEMPRFPVIHIFDERNMPMYYPTGVPILGFYDAYGELQEWSPEAEAAELSRSQRQPGHPHTQNSGWSMNGQPRPHMGYHTSNKKSPALERASQYATPHITEPPVQHQPSIATVEETIPLFEGGVKLETISGEVVTAYPKENVSFRGAGADHWPENLGRIGEDYTVLISLDKRGAREYLVGKEKMERAKHIPPSIIKLEKGEGRKEDVAKEQESQDYTGFEITLNSEVITASTLDDAVMALNLLHEDAINAIQVEYDAVLRGAALSEDCIDMWQEIESAAGKKSDSFVLTILAEFMTKAAEESPATFMWMNKEMTMLAIFIVRHQLGKERPMFEMDSFAEDATELFELLKGEGAIHEFQKLFVAALLDSFSFRNYPVDVAEDSEIQQDRNLYATVNRMKRLMVELDSVSSYNIGRMLGVHDPVLYRTILGVRKLDVMGYRTDRFYLYSKNGQILDIALVGQDFPRVYILNIL